MNFTIEIASVPDRRGVVVEVWWGDAMVAELHRCADGGVDIEIYPAEARVPWRFELASWLAALSEAQRKLG